MGEADVEIYNGQLKIKHRTLVANTEYVFILKMDLINSHELTVNPVEKILHLANEKCILNKRCTESKPVKLIA